MFSKHYKNYIFIDVEMFWDILSQDRKKFTTNDIVLFDYFYEVAENNYNYGKISLKSLLDKYPSLLLKKQTFREKIRYFISLKLIEIKDNMSPSDVFDKLNIENSSDGCLFCGYDKVPCHNHHYPIRAEHGGTETVSLCPNCHTLFHSLADHNNKIRINWRTLGVTKEEYETREARFNAKHGVN